MLYSIIKNIRSITLAILLIYGWIGINGQNNQNFINISVNEGLSQSTIFSIYQDSKGFMWFGTRGGGLNKYDGYDFHEYMHLPEVAGSLTDNTILSILEDSRGDLWVGTRNGGINRFERTMERFINYPLNINFEVYQDLSQAVRCIYEDKSGKIWIGTNQKVYCYNREMDQFDQVMDDAPFPIKGTTSICEDEEGYVYFATWDRLIRYFPEKGSYEQLIFPIDPFVDFGGRINPLLLDSKNRLWLGTPKGLHIVEIDKGFSFSSVLLDQVEWPSSFQYVRTIKETVDGNLWFGTKPFTTNLF